MPSEVRHVVDSGQAYPVVRLAGVLDATAAPVIRAALLDVLGDQPEALVVDASELTVDRPEHSAVLADVARETVAWPAAGLVVCTPHPTPQLAGLTVCGTPEEAFAALGAPDPGGFERVTGLEPALGAARRARELVNAACERWRLAHLAADAGIVLSEMVNNVVAHARTEMAVLLRRHGPTISVAVRDRSPRIPRFTGSPVPVTSYGGRGLLLIDAVADSWGSLALPGGKVVWACLGIRPAADRSRPAGMAPCGGG